MGFNGHILIVGMTASGKSSLAKLLCRELKKSGQLTAVLDPIGDPEYDVNFRTKDSEEFLAFAKANKDHFLFVDESGLAIGRYNESMQWLATTARHAGHLCVFVTQGMTQLPPIVRGQCGTLYVFTSASSNAQMAAEDYNEKTLLEIDRIPQYHFLKVSRFAPLKRGKILLDTPYVEYDN